MYIHTLAENRDQIIYCESRSNYSWIYFRDGRKVFVAKSLRVLEGILTPCSFIRVHHKFLVNKDCIEFFSKTDFKVRLINQEMVPVARRRRGFFKKSLDSRLTA